MAGHPEPSSAPTATVDLSALVSNFRLALRHVGGSSRILAMVKGDAYGHGASDVVRTLVGAGCEEFGVATCSEAADVRAAGARRVVIFGGVLAGDLDELFASGAELVLSDVATAEAAAVRARAAGRRLRVHLGVDTGMRRLGAEPGDLPELARRVAALPELEAVALCTHFADAEAPDGLMLARQLSDLRAVYEAVRGVTGPLHLHAANSAALLAHRSSHLDMVRPGLMLYGLSPRPGMVGEEELRAVMRLVAPVMRVAELAVGEGVGYGHTFRAARPTRLATLRIGYADGYPRSLSGCGRVWLGGASAPVVGRVCMDHVMVDVTDLPRPALGAEAVLWGPELPAESVAELAGTISYELVARVGARVNRLTTNPGRLEVGRALGGKKS
jgi:alanine racemase